MSKPKVYADLHNLDEFNRLRLICAGTIDDLNRQGIELCERLALTFYMDDADDHGGPDELRWEGVAHYAESERVWGRFGRMVFDSSRVGREELHAGCRRFIGAGENG